MNNQRALKVIAVGIDLVDMEVDDPGSGNDESGSQYQRYLGPYRSPFSGSILPEV